MSKLLKAVAKRHRPHIAAKMTTENGYDENKHLTAKDLRNAGIISSDEHDDLSACLDDLEADGQPVKSALKNSSAEQLNDDDFVNQLMGIIGDDDGAIDDDDDNDDDAEDGDNATA